MKNFKVYIYLNTSNGSKTLVYYVNVIEEAETIIIKAKKRRTYDGFRLFQYDEYYEKYDQISCEL